MTTLERYPEDIQIMLSAASKQLTEGRGIPCPIFRAFGKDKEIVITTDGTYSKRDLIVILAGHFLLHAVYKYYVLFEGTKTVDDSDEKEIISVVKVDKDSKIAYVFEILRAGGSVDLIHTNTLDDPTGAFVQLLPPQDVELDEESQKELAKLLQNTGMPWKDYIDAIKREKENESTH